MKILVVSSMIFPLPPPAYGGLEVVAFDQAESLTLLGHEVYLLCPGGSKSKIIPKDRLLTPVGPNSPDAAAYEAVKLSLRDYDLIMDHSWGGYPYMAKRQWPKLRVVHTLHGVQPYFSNPVPKPCWVTPSRWHADYTAKLLGEATRPEVVYHGIDLGRHAFSGTKSPEDYLLYMARIVDFKGALEFVELCLKTGMRGYLCGEDIFVDDPVGYPSRVMRACEQTRGQVRYMGRTEQEHKVELMQGARCLVTPLLPPYYEIFGLTTIEAQACGTPVLSTDRGAARELIVHGKTGAIAADASCLTSNLEIALACASEDCRAQAERFSREKMAVDYASLFERVVDKGEEW